MSFTPETKVKEIALSHAGARHVLEDARIDYCCGGGKSLHDACRNTGVSADEILRRLRESSDKAGADANDWGSASLSDLTRHIRERHHAYVRDAIPRIGALLEKVKAKHGAAHGEIATIQELFTQVGAEMIAHMQKEERILFPFIEEMERSARGNGPLEPPFFGTVRNPIQAMMAEHDTAGDLVRQIRRASGGYSAPAAACASFKALYEDLERFEADLHLHVHLENNILFPRAMETEAAAQEA